MVGGGLCSDTGATAFNGSYVGTIRSGAFGQMLTPAKVGFLVGTLHACCQSA